MDHLLSRRPRRYASALSSRRALSGNTEGEARFLYCILGVSHRLHAKTKGFKQVELKTEFVSCKAKNSISY